MTSIRADHIQQRSRTYARGHFGRSATTFRPESGPKVVASRPKWSLPTGYRSVISAIGCLT